MKFIQLTRRNGEHIWVNMEHVCHIDRSRDVTVLRFVGAGGDGGLSSVTVEETPLTILGKV